MPKAGLISLTFDDALDEHLDHAIPLLAAHGVSATFYVPVSAPAFLRRIDEWRRVAEDGHELGNHTIFHPATERKSWVVPGNAIESYCLDRMRLEIETANRMLEALDGQTQRTFAYPCSVTVLGRHGWPNRLLHHLGLERTRWPGLLERSSMDWGSSLQSYVCLLEHLVFAARGGGLMLDSVIPAPNTMRRYEIPSAAVEGHSFSAMRAFVERGLARNFWTILQFHGVGGGHHMNCRLDDFRDLVNWLGDHHGDRVVTVVQGARTLWSAEAVSANVSEVVLA